MQVIKALAVYSPSGTRRTTNNAIYEPELASLLTKGAVKQLLITVIDGGYSLAVLTHQREEITTRPHAEKNERIVRMRKVRIEIEGFAPLFAVRNKSLRVYRSLDTLIRSLMRFGPLPPTTIQQGSKP